MNKKEQTKLIASYKIYRKTKTEKKDLLRLFRMAMPELIFRTTKLEGEPITRRMISALFK